VKKCPYCDFNSHAQSGELPEKAYIERLLEDLANDAPRVVGREIQTIFIGGGTPSLFSPDAYRWLFAGIREHIAIAPDAEITLEANPGTIEYGQFSGYRDVGVNRVSLGVQSFNNEHLKKLGRIHRDQEVVQAVAELKHAGFDNFNLDLMHGLPDQTQTQAINDLHRAIELAPTHLSWYQLTLEPNTVFYSKPPKLPDDDQLADIEEAGKVVLENAGYRQYETSAYSKMGKQCRHNLNYWRFGDYLGIGAGAHGKITDLTTGQITRLWKKKQPKAYLDHTQSLIGGEEQIAPDQISFEFMLNALRLMEGFSIELYEQTTGLAFQGIDPIVQQTIQRGLLKRMDQQIIPTDLGARFLNETLLLFQ
jgi:putative oxygen-independent coproporphyrinogen III oxidase